MGTVDDDISIRNGWNVYSLKSYVDQRFLDSDKAVSAALQAAKEAVAKAEVATEKRFDALSEEADRRAEDLSEKIGHVQTSVIRQQGTTEGADEHRSMLAQNIYALGAVGGFATAIITLIITHH
jgi:hypothetical protein